MADYKFGFCFMGLCLFIWVELMTEVQAYPEMTSAD